MILSFMTNWGKDMPPHMAGKPTYFPEKIIAGLDLQDYKKMTLHDHLAEVMPTTVEQFDKGATNPSFPHHPKLHTIRADPKNRWREGMKINYYINSRQPNMFEFAPTGIVKNIQNIKIVYWSKESDYPYVEIGHNRFYAYEKDGYETIEQLARNDGFDSVADFFRYFNKDFVGRLIHWTDLKY